MDIKFENGRVVTTGIACDEIPYDVSNNSITVQFNGRCGINSYLKINDKKFFDGIHTFKFFIDGAELPFNTPKKVENIGRTQTVTYYAQSAEIKAVSALDVKANAVITSIEISPRQSISFAFAMFMVDGISQRSFQCADGTVRRERNGFALASDAAIVCDNENQSVVLNPEEISAPKKIHLVYGFQLEDAVDVLNHAGQYIEGAFAEIDNVKLPEGITTEEDKALYYSAYFCALENYKELGDFKAFMAGCRYVFPPRTYYRDSYFTVLCMYNGHTDKVRNEILCLSRAIEEDGSCPSAVIYDYSAFWGNHMDSPSLYVILIYDYVNNTKDTSVLYEQVGGNTVLELMKRVLEKQSRSCDETGLLVKRGAFNRLDWADEVNRYGYVAYDEILYARALYCYSMILKHENLAGAEAYGQRFEQVKAAINRYLWMDDKGYYLNFTNEDYTEDNLSIDTVLAVLYEIADEDQSKRLLQNCINMLDSRNNPDVETFGMFCVYPLYKSMKAAVNKSANPFNYHNGSDWPYWSAMLAYAFKKYGFEYEFALKNWFFYNLKKGNYTPIEYFSPYCKDGSLLQAWSSTAAFVYNDTDMSFFSNKL